jgi:hypothetical protein
VDIAVAVAFEDNEELVRYVHPTERSGHNRASLSVFELDATDLGSTAPHLSVNSLATEPIDVIVRYYQKRRQEGVGDVSVCSHTVATYVKLGKNPGGGTLNKAANGPWTFPEQETEVEAFKKRPVPTGDDGLKSPSHSGVEFIRSLTELNRRKLARKLAQYPKFKVYTVT